MTEVDTSNIQDSDIAELMTNVQQITDENDQIKLQSNYTDHKQI